MVMAQKNKVIGITENRMLASRIAFVTEYNELLRASPRGISIEDSMLSRFWGRRKPVEGICVKEKVGPMKAAAKTREQVQLNKWTSATSSRIKSHWHDSDILPRLGRCVSSASKADEASPQQLRIEF